MIQLGWQSTRGTLLNFSIKKGGNGLKKLVAMILVVAMAFGLTGCYGGEIELYNAMEKMNKIETMESKMEMDFSFSTEGFAEEEQLMFDEVAELLNDMKIKINMKQTQNEDQTASKAEMFTDIHLADMDMNMKQWVDVDLSKDNPKMLQIIKMPEEAMTTMVPEGMNKEYIRFDMMAQEELGDNFDELIEFTEEFTPKLMEFMNEFYADFDGGKDFLSKKDSKVIDGKYLDIFEVKLDDSGLKSLLRYGVNHTLENDTTMDFIKEYMDIVMSISAIPEDEKDEMETEIQDGLKDLETQLPEFRTIFNDFMDKYGEIQVLGEDGISMEIGIDRRGYVAHQAGSIDIRIDAGQIAKALELDPIEGIINMGINFKTRNFNINNKLIWIRMPKLTEGNSIEYMDLLDAQMKQFEEELKALEEMEDFDIEGLEEIEDAEDLEAVEEVEEAEVNEIKEIEETDETEEVEATEKPAA